MTYNDFNLILIESIVHVDKNIFFENKREDSNYPKRAYAKGLLDAFKTLKYYAVANPMPISLLPEKGENFHLKLYADDFEQIWCNLYAYFKPIFHLTDPTSPPPKKPEEVDTSWNHIILLPDSIIRLFILNSHGPNLLNINGNISGIENPLIFESMLFNRIYLGFNEFIWKNATVEISRNWFKVNPMGKPDFIDGMETYFCYAFSKFEPSIIREYRPKNINVWIKPLINGNNYSGLKGRKDNEQIIREIDHIVTLIENPR
jgi:hypothetical protein